MSEAPYSVDAERAVLGSIFIDPACIPNIISSIGDNGEAFYVPQNQRVASVILDMVAECVPVDIVTVMDRLTHDEDKDCLSDLAGSPLTSSNVEYYAKILRDNHERRQLIVASRGAERKAQSQDIPICETIEEHTAQVSSIREVELPCDYMEETGDPGPIPADMLFVPGFIERVVNYSMDQAPHPNPYMSFCGALGLMALVTGRKAVDSMDNLTNIYLLGLAESGAGKNMPRTVNNRIMHQVSMNTRDELAMTSVVNKFGSSEGIEDALIRSPRILWQRDEMDSLITDLARGGDSNSHKIMETMLQLFTESSSIYMRRLLAHAEKAQIIQKPCLSMFGTAIPSHFYDALSDKMMSNGFFSRLLIIEDSCQRVCNRPVSRPIPESIITEAEFWWMWGSERGGVTSQEVPILRKIPYDSHAEALSWEMRLMCRDEYNKYVKTGDSLGTSVWSRAYEMIRKLSMLYACSASWQYPLVDFAAVEWASMLVRHQCLRMVYKAREKSFGSTHEQNVKKVMEHLRASENGSLKSSEISRKSQYLSKKELDEVMDSMIESGMIKEHTTSGRGRPAKIYTLVK